MYLRFFKTKTHCAPFILLQALYRTHSKKNLPNDLITFQSNTGSMGELLSGYPDPAYLRKGPRVTGAAQSNYIKNRGTFNNILDQNANRNDRPETHVPKVYYEGRDNREQGNGTVGNLFNYYGALPQSARQVPRVKAEATYNYEHGRGSAMGKALTMVPQSSRPGSATFFGMKP